MLQAGGCKCKRQLFAHLFEFHFDMVEVTV